MTYWFVLYLFIYLALEALSVVAFKFAGRVILLFIYLFIYCISFFVDLFIHFSKSVESSGDEQD